MQIFYDFIQKGKRANPTRLAQCEKLIAPQFLNHKLTTFLADFSLSSYTGGQHGGCPMTAGIDWITTGKVVNLPRRFMIEP